MQKKIKVNKWWPKSCYHEGTAQRGDGEMMGGISVGEGHSIRTISTIIPSVPVWPGGGFSNQFHFRSEATVVGLWVGSLWCCSSLGSGQSRDEGWQGELWGWKDVKSGRLFFFFSVSSKFYWSFTMSLRHSKVFMLVS